MDSIDRRAMRYAVKAHLGQKRKLSGKPYIVHPVWVGFILDFAYNDKSITAAGYLHDVLEDTDITEVTLANRFGWWVTQRVIDVTKVPGVKWKYPTHPDSVRLKVADMLDNALETEAMIDQIGEDEAWSMFNDGKGKLDYWDNFLYYAIGFIGLELPVRSLQNTLERLGKVA